MCIIIDANCRDIFLSNVAENKHEEKKPDGYQGVRRKGGQPKPIRPEDMNPIKEFIKSKKGVLVFSDEYYKLKKEMNSRMIDMLNKYRASGAAVLIPAKKIKEEEDKLDVENLCAKNDVHIIALAKASGATVLVSQDKDLHTDFKSKCKGHVYQSKDHEHLLRKFKCRCGF